MICGERHESGVACVLVEGQHETHVAVDRTTFPPTSVEWANEGYIAPLRTSTKGTREKQKAHLREAVRTGQAHTPSDPTKSMTSAWASSKAQWIADAKRTVHAFCQQHDEPFTTPEAIWPLLDSPGEMRAFVVVVQHALRSRWMSEVDTVRLREEYHTRDGLTFKMNKIVPVYRSSIFIDPDL